MHTVDRQVLGFLPWLSPVATGSTQRHNLSCLCTSATSAFGTSRGATDTSSCDIYSLADPDWNAVADINFDSTSDLDVHSATYIDSDPNIDSAAADSAGKYCGGLGHQAGVALTR